MCWSLSCVSFGVWVTTCIGAASVFLSFSVLYRNMLHHVFPPTSPPTAAVSPCGSRFASLKLLFWNKGKIRVVSIACWPLDFCIAPLWFFSETFKDMRTNSKPQIPIMLNLGSFLHSQASAASMKNFKTGYEFQMFLISYLKNRENMCMHIYIKKYMYDSVHIFV